VAVSGDTLVVGAIGEDSSTTGVGSTPNETSVSSGAAYVFVRSAGVWTQQAYLKPAAVGTTQVGDAFGTSVAVSGDRVVVGAPSEDSSTTGVNSAPDDIFGPNSNSGAACLFTIGLSLTAPPTNAVTINAVPVTFTLPEDALGGSVKLVFTGTVTRTLTLAASQETLGTHTFTFHPASPTATPEIAGGSPIPEGIYTVTLSYQDVLGNPEVSSEPALNVTVNIDTDGDGIFDRYETGTGIYVSPFDTGTSPMNRDSDGDGLNDGVEVNFYLSNPNLHDTDGDGFGDGFEVSAGFSPTSAASTPDAQSSILTAVEYRFNAANGISYRIEASIDLAIWTTIETNIIGAGGVVTRFYSIEGQPKRFFRSRRN